MSSTSPCVASRTTPDAGLRTRDRTQSRLPDGRCSRVPTSSGPGGTAAATRPRPPSNRRRRSEPAADRAPAAHAAAIGRSPIAGRRRRRCQRLSPCRESICARAGNGQVADHAADRAAADCAADDRAARPAADSAPACRTDRACTASDTAGSRCADRTAGRTSDSARARTAGRTGAAACAGPPAAAAAPIERLAAPAAPKALAPPVEVPPARRRSCRHRSIVWRCRGSSTSSRRRRAWSRRVRPQRRWPRLRGAHRGRAGSAVRECQADAGNVGVVAPAPRRHPAPRRAGRRRTAATAAGRARCRRRHFQAEARCLAPPGDSSATHIDMDAARQRAREIASEATSARGILPALPPPPERKSKESTALEKAVKPDCRTAYAGMGLLAVPVLVASTIGDGGCRW